MADPIKHIFARDGHIPAGRDPDGEHAILALVDRPKERDAAKASVIHIKNIPDNDGTAPISNVNGG